MRKENAKISSKRSGSKGKNTLRDFQIYICML